MEKPTLIDVRNAFAVEKGYEDWEELRENSNATSLNTYNRKTRDTFDDLVEEYEDWLEGQATEMPKSCKDCTCPEGYSCDIQAGIPKEHSLAIDISKLDENQSVFDAAKQWETVTGNHPVKIGFVHEQIVRGYVYLEGEWLDFRWRLSDLVALDYEYKVYEYSTKFALREKKARKQISHTFYVVEDGYCFSGPGVDVTGAFAEVTVNVEVQEGDKIVITR